MPELKKYKLKMEFKDLFRNFSSSDGYMGLKECFTKKGVCEGKGFAHSETDKMALHEETIKKLIDSGFIEVEETPITIKCR